MNQLYTCLFKKEPLIFLYLVLERGARLAEPGEFTKRAFLNGRLDLVQAEAVIDLVKARSEKGFDVAIHQLEGSLSKEVSRIRDQLMDLLVQLAVNIDYPDEDIEEMTYEFLKESLSQIGDEIENIISTADTGRMIREGIGVAIVGKPNVGKSSLINRLTGRKSTQVGDRPGVTRGKQWLTIQQDMQLLDTPGILWPKFEDPKAGLNLAFCGSIKDEVMDLPTLALELIRVLQEDYPKLLKARYKLEEVSEEALETMEQISRNRGFILPGKRIDYERTARTVLDEFRSGQIGRITLEKADGDEKK